MIVSLQNRGLSVSGLRIGSSNVRRYFPDGTRTIDLQLEHLHIRCDLQPSFWHDQPEISDPRLCAWLEAKNLHAKLRRTRFSLAMEPAGCDSYRLRPLGSADGLPRTRAKRLRRP
jgi:hypothetical protein